MAALPASSGIDFLYRAERLVDEGADCLDVFAFGDGSGRPLEEQELDLLPPTVEALRSRFDVPISVVTGRAEVLRRCLENGADVGHDVGGFTDQDFLPVASSFDASVIVVAADRGAAGFAVDPVMALADLTGRASVAGLPRKRILVEIGLDPSRSADPSASVAWAEAVFALGYPVLLGATDQELLCRLVDTGVETVGEPAVDTASTLTAAHVAAIRRGCRMIRTGDVRAGRRMADLMAEILSARVTA